MSSRLLNVELHPMQNAEIFSTIFSFCSVRDMKSCPFVGSKWWLKASMNSGRENAVLTIKPEPANPGSDVPGISYTEFQNIYEDESGPFQLGKLPCKNLKLENFRYSHFQNSELSWILDKLSDKIRYIAFKDYEFLSMESSLETILVRLPNLVQLKLNRDYLLNDLTREDLENLNELHYPKHQNLKCIMLENDVWSRHIFSKWFPVLIKHLVVSNDIRALIKMTFYSPCKQISVDGGSVGRIFIKLILTRDYGLVSN